MTKVLKFDIKSVSANGYWLACMGWSPLITSHNFLERRLVSHSLPCDLASEFRFLVDIRQNDCS